MNYLKRILPVVLAAVLAVTSVVPAFAADTAASVPTEKEEVVYITLGADGSLENTYVVNSFKGGAVIDYGNYSSVKMLNTSDPIKQDRDAITFSSSAKKAYYQGNLDNAEIPWNISLRYYLDGEEYSADEIAGKSGALEIRFKITENTSCSGTFYDDYALQASFTLDTEQCGNISAPGATLANVGSKKQINYTILPGRGIDTAISADVTNFEMSAISINGIHLNLNVEIDDTELKDKINELINAVEQLDEGASKLSGGSGDLLDGSAGLKNGASSLHSGITSLDEGVVTLQNGLGMVQGGLDSLSAQSGMLVNGSAQFKSALLTIQRAVNSISVDNKDLTALAAASGQIKQAIGDLYDGTAALQANLGYAQYKALMRENGLDIDALKDGNSQTANTLGQQIKTLQGTLAQIQGVPGMESQAEQLQEQIGQLQQIVTLLMENNAAIGGTESYLDGIAGQLPALTQGLSKLKTQYETFEAAIGQLVDTLGNMTGNLSDLAEGINKLVESYAEVDSGIGTYTDGVAKIAAGYSQVMQGVSSLAEGSKELVFGSGELYDGTAELYDGVVSLCEGAKEMAEGTGNFRTQTANMNEQMDEKIESLLESIGGSMENPVSFASEKNSNVNAVQFVIQTKEIEMEEAEAVPETTGEKLSLWEKFLNLFR